MSTFVLTIPAREATMGLAWAVGSVKGDTIQLDPGSSLSNMWAYGSLEELTALKDLLEEETADGPLPVKNATITKQTEPYWFFNSKEQCMECADPAHA